MIDIRDTLVVNLRDDEDRRRHIVDHFAAIGLDRYRFWPAVDHRDAEVAAAYREGLVASFPPCFRCGRADCQCPNNVLIPQQVANWLSFLSLWRSLPDDPDTYVLVCEDDVAFHHNAMHGLSAFLRGFSRSREHVLVRMAQSGEEPFRELPQATPRCTDRVVMSNAAYLLNGSMARWLVRRLDRISTTSDIWLHRTCAASPEVQALTLEPLLATELSFNRDHARFHSRIHPKGIDDADRVRQAVHTKRVDTPEAYVALRALWSGSTPSDG